MKKLLNNPDILCKLYPDIIKLWTQGFAQTAG